MYAIHQTGYVMTMVEQATKKALYSFADHAGLKGRWKTEYMLAAEAAEIHYT